VYLKQPPPSLPLKRGGVKRFEKQRINENQKSLPLSGGDLEGAINNPKKGENMNKNAIKKFAIDSRNWLIEKTILKLNELGITEKGIAGIYQQTETEIKVTDLSKPVNRIQYEALKNYAIGLKKSYGDNWYSELVEESAYNWFNRIVGIKYMEVNGYLPENINILTSTTGSLETDIILNYEYLSYADKLDKNFIRNGILNHQTEEVFRYLFLMENHQLSKVMPFMFPKENDFSDLIFPEGILGESGIIKKINTLIPKEDWEEIEIIGWLYQFYNSEKKDEVFLGLKKNKKLTKDTIPAATQLFTPKWIVKYMVENSLGKLAIEELGIRESIKENWKYFIEPIKSEELIVKSEGMKIEDLKLLDPSMGSGHILVYAFDVLYQIYEELGYSKREAVSSIIQNNIYGMDIDDRAGTLANFAILMKAREYFPRIFTVLENEGIELNTLSIQESNVLGEGFISKIQEEKFEELLKVIELFNDAKEYGSILKVEGIDLEKVQRELIEFEEKEKFFYTQEKELLRILIKQAKIMSQKYDVTVTNPPYMGNAGMTEHLKKYLKKNYPNSEKDMMTAFMDLAFNITKVSGIISMINLPSWMFLSSFEDLRNFIVNNKTIINLVDNGRGVFGSDFGSVSFVIKNSLVEGYQGVYRRLIKRKGAVENNEIKEEWFLDKEFNKFITSQEDFHKIPGSPIAYWVSDRVKEIFATSEKLGDVGDAKQGLATADNNRFLRYWSEVNKSSYKLNCKSNGEALESGKKWFPYNKGGEKRRWYGNQEYLINWENDGNEIKNFKNSVVRNPTFYFKESISWGLITSGGCSFRYFPNGFIYDVAGMSYFTEKDMLHTLGILNNKLYYDLTKVLNPTINLQIGDVANLPYANFENIKFDEIVQQNIDIAKEEWDSRESSWDFSRSALVNSEELIVNKNISENPCSSVVVKISQAFDSYSKYWKEKFYEIHRNEEELNRLFIEIYGLEDEMTPDVDLKDITLLKKELLRRKSAKKATEEEEAEEAGLILDDKGEIQFNKEEIIKQFISYAIGCNMGRYSIDKEGLVIANSDDKLIINSEELRVVGVMPLANPNNNPMPLANPNESEKIGFSNGKPLQTNESIDENIRHQIANPKYTPNIDGIIPVTDTNYFAGQDIVERFEEFLVAVYGRDSLEDNLNFIGKAIKDSNNDAREILREYFMGDFYADHLQRYSKRPIYWLVSSNNKGKGATFNAYIYLHRYNKNTIPTIRGKYVNELQAKLKFKEEGVEKRLLEDDLNAREKKELKGEKDKYRKQINELLEFDKKLNALSNQMIELDLDDGVKVNYEKLADILYKVKM